MSSILNGLVELAKSTGIYGFLQSGGWGNAVMILVGFFLFYLAIKKGFEPLLLVPIAMGCVLSNIPFAYIAGSPDPTNGAIGFIQILYNAGIESGLFPVLIFMGVGAMTDFGPLIANPRTLLLGAAAQLGIFTALIGALMFGNLCKECGVVNRLSDTMQNALMNIVTICRGLSVGSKMAAEKFLNLETLGILLLGMVAFGIGTAGGLLLAKLMNKLSPKNPINPLIGAAGVSAVPMAARVASKVGQEADPQNFLLMHAMGPNVSGVIGSAVAAGVLMKVVPILTGGLL